MYEENHMGWKLVKGVRKDVVNLFKLFANTNSVRFEDFSKAWKEMKFSLIFRNRITFVELLEFSEELMQIVKEYLLSVYEFHTRVAALYTIYGLYFKQPIKGATKIRLTKTEWEEVYSLVEKSKKAQHYDVAFIFLKLYICGAFSFVATTRAAGLERGFRKYSEKRNELYNKVCDVELLYRPLISEKLVDSLVKLESLYCTKKSELLGGKNLVFIDGHFAKTLKEDLKNYESTSLGQSKEKIEVHGDKDLKKLNSKNSTEDAVQMKPSKAKKNKKQTQNKDNNEEVPSKVKRFRKKQLDLLAKRKAEYYIRKLQLESEKNEPVESNKSLMSLDEIDFSD